MKKKETLLSVAQEIRDILKAWSVFNKLSVIQKPAQEKIGRFTKLPDGWVKDKTTSLEWGPGSSNEMNWEEAKKHCVDLGGRLPTVRELESLVDRTKCNPATDQDAFPDVKSSWYWTSEKVAGIPGCVWVVGFDYGVVDGYHEGGDGYVRPVRSSQ